MIKHEPASNLDYRDTFMSPQGKRVLAELNRMFNPDDLTTKDPHTTIVRAAASKPIREINRRVQDGMDGNTTR